MTSRQCRQAVPSYYVSRDARDVVVLARPHITRTWRRTRLGDFRSFISPIVLEEAVGDEGLHAKAAFDASSGLR